MTRYLRLFGTFAVVASSVFFSVAIVDCAVRRFDENVLPVEAGIIEYVDEAPKEFTVTSDSRSSSSAGGGSASSDNLETSASARNPKIIELDALDPRQQQHSSSYSIVETSNGPNLVTLTKTNTQYDPEKRSRVANLNNGERRPSSNGFNRKKEKEPTLSQQKQELKPAGTAHPKNIGEIVDPPPLQPAGSGTFLSGSIGDEFGGGYEKEKHFDKEGGKKYVEAHKAEKGEKAKQGYKKEEGYDKAEKEKHGKEEKKAVVAEKEGDKSAKVDQAKHFGEEYKGQHGEKDKSVTTKGGHKKGHKKKGFHKVHHKDEYKKDEVFYDEEHDGADKEEHAHEHVKHAKEKGGQEKKGHVDQTYHEGHAEKKGVQNKGKHYEEAAGHKAEAGEEAHHDKHSKYGKKGGVKEGKKYGHKEGGGHGGGEYYEHDAFDD